MAEVIRPPAVHHPHMAPLHPLHPPKSTPAMRAHAEEIAIPVHDEVGGEVRGILHVAYQDGQAVPANGGGVILISGVGGGVSGPSGMYPSLADKISTLLHLPTLRLDYRKAAETKWCSNDVERAMDWMQEKFDGEKGKCERFVVVGWSFGGAPAFTVAGRNKKVAGVATIASQTAEADGISGLAPRPVLLMHGTGDTSLSPLCAEKLWRMYGEKDKVGNDEIGNDGISRMRLWEGDDHILTRFSLEAEKMLFEFVGHVIFGKDWHESRQDEHNVERNLMGNTMTKQRTMSEGGDLDGGESLGWRGKV